VENALGHNRRGHRQNPMEVAQPATIRYKALDAFPKSYSCGGQKTEFTIFIKRINKTKAGANHKMPHTLYTLAVSYNFIKN